MPEGYDPLSINAQVSAILARHDAIFEHLQAQDRTLEKILAQTTATNGRVTDAEHQLEALEKQQIYATQQREEIRTRQAENTAGLRSLRLTIRRALWTAGGMWVTGAAVVWMIEHGWLLVPGLKH